MSIGVPGVEQRRRSLGEDVEIEAERPLVDMIEIVQHALPDLSLVSVSLPGFAR